VKALSLIIVTGMSGAGKSVVANALEDIGFYCIDNIPPSLIKPVAELSSLGDNEMRKVAIVTDIRGGKMFKDVIPTLNALKESGHDIKLLFLDASDEKLITRYKETRRRHPMAGDTGMSIADAVKAEREMLMPLMDISDYCIDTTKTSTANLKERVTGLFLSDISEGMTVQVLSFGFKNGCVSEADIVFDVRCLANPFYVEELRPLTGLDIPVKDFVLNIPETKELADRLLSLIDYSVPLYCKEGKSELVIAIGCTGGKHRSVVFAELVAEHLKKQNYHTVVNHRDISKE
jgi:UPF0042 nucleotide-binding protein